MIKLHVLEVVHRLLDRLRGLLRRHVAVDVLLLLVRALHDRHWAGRELRDDGIMVDVVG